MVDFPDDGPSPPQTPWPWHFENRFRLSMKITCPTCTSEYDLDENTIGPDGRKVRCVECKTVWTVTSQNPFDRLRALEEPEKELFSAGPAADPPADPVPENQLLVIEAAAPKPAKTADPSAELDAWIAIASEHAVTTDPENDQNSVDALFDDAPAEPITDVEEPITADNDAMPEEASAEEIIPVSPVQRIRRGLINAHNAHIGQFRTKKNRTVPLVAASVAVLVGVLMALIGFRDGIVATVPQMAGLYRAIGIHVNLRGLEIINIASQMTEADGVQVLVVKGEITNPGPDARPLPPIFFAVLDETEKEQYAWSAALDQPTIEAGATMPFRRRLASPPAEGRKVMVRFMKEGDPKPAGMKEPAPAEPPKEPPKEPLP